MRQAFLLHRSESHLEALVCHVEQLHEHLRLLTFKLSLAWQKAHCKPRAIHGCRLGIRTTVPFQPSRRGKLPQSPGVTLLLRSAWPAPTLRLHDVPLFGALDAGSSFPNGSWPEFLRHERHGAETELSLRLKLRPDADKSEDPNAAKTADEQPNQSRPLDPWGGYVQCLKAVRKENCGNGCCPSGA